MLQLQTVEPSTLGLLRDLQSKDYLQKYYLVGGTAIALYMGHRMSIDLDLFTFEDFDPDDLKTQLIRDFEDVKIDLQSPSTLLCKINGIKTDFIKYPYPAQYPIMEEEGIKLLALEDLTAMKLSAVSGRGKKKDFYDIYFLLQQFTLRQMLTFFEEKFEQFSLFHLLKSLVYFEDAEPDAEPIVFSKITWQKIKKAIQEKVRNF